MKNSYLFLLIVSLLFAFSCNNTDQKEQSQNKANIGKPEAVLQVIYFHSTNRCATCNAVENNAKKLLEENFKTQIEAGQIYFTSLNIDEEQNKSLTEKYLISTSSLLIINNKTKEPTVIDFTDNAFKYARTEPIKYSDLLKEEISKQLGVL